MSGILCIAYLTLLVYAVSVFIRMSQGFTMQEILRKKPDLEAQLPVTIEQKCND